MAAILAEGDILEGKFFCRDESQTGINVVHFYVAGVAGGSLTDQQVCTALSTLAGPLYRAWMAAGQRYSGMRLQRIRPLPAPVAVTSTVGNGAGTGGGSALPSQSALLVSKRSLFAGRANRGRAYLPFWSDAFNSADGHPTAAGLALAQAWATQFLSALNVAVGGASVSLLAVVYNRASGGSVVISNAIIRDAWATQRRRSEINRPDSTGP